MKVLICKADVFYISDVTIRRKHRASLLGYVPHARQIWLGKIFFDTENEF